MKFCKECKEIKPLTDFYKVKSTIDGRHNRCRPCFSARALLHFKRNRTLRLGQMKEYKLKNIEKYRAAQNNYQKRRKRTDPVYKLAKNLRYRLNKALRGQYKSGSQQLQMLGVLWNI